MSDESPIAMLSGALFVCALLVAVPASLGLFAPNSAAWAQVFASGFGPVMAVLIGGVLIFRYQERQTQVRVRAEKLWGYRLDVVRGLLDLRQQLSHLRMEIVTTRGSSRSSNPQGEIELLTKYNMIVSDTVRLRLDLTLSFDVGATQRLSETLRLMSDTPTVSDEKIKTGMSAIDDLLFKDLLPRLLLTDPADVRQLLGNSGLRGRSGRSV